MTTCAWIAAAVEPNLVGQQLLTDREHRAIESVNGRPLASAVTGTQPDGRLHLHRPDLVLVTDGGDAEMVAIEVELTLKPASASSASSAATHGTGGSQAFATTPRRQSLRPFAVRRIDRVPQISWRSVHSHARATAAVTDTAINMKQEDMMSDAAVPLDQQLLTADEVADLLRLPTSTVYDLTRTGRLPHLRIGRAIRFSRSDLEVFLAECRATSPRDAGIRGGLRAID